MSSGSILNSNNDDNYEAYFLNKVVIVAGAAGAVISIVD